MKMQNGYNLPSISAEKCVIACLIKDPTLLTEHSLNTEHFLESRHRQIFEAMYVLSNDNMAIGVDSLALKCGGEFQYILDIADMPVSMDNFHEYELEVIDLWKQREARNVLRMTEHEMFTGGAIPSLIRSLEQIDEKGTKEEVPTHSVIDDVIDLAYNKNEEFVGYKTGLKVFDKVTGGLRRKELSYWCARPSVGKTAVSVDIMKRLVFKSKVAVLYFTFEMAKSGLIIRLMSNMTKIDSRRIPEAHATFTQAEADRWASAGADLKKQNLEIIETVGNTNYIRSCIRKFKKDNPDIDFIIMIDYLTKIKPIHDYGGNAHMQITEISAELKEIAKDFDTHVACLAQLSRGVEGRQDKRPMMSDIRESGSIEQDGDLINMLFRPDYQTEEDNKPDQELEINVIKNRNGAVGVCKFTLNKPTGRLEEKYL
jgi:replicative DNA helicase